MSIRETGVLVTGLGLEPENGLYTVGADRVDRIPFDSMEAVLITNVTAATVASVADVVRLRFGAARSMVWAAYTNTDVIYRVAANGDDVEASWPDASEINTTDAYKMALVIASADAAKPEPFTLAPLRDVVAALRAPDGCPWDRLQTHSTLRRYLLEEVYEILDAIDNNDVANLKEELGDVLLQIVFHARLAEERGDFTVQDVIDNVTDKMIRRHPHVFGDADSRSIAAISLNWEAIKAKEPGHKRKGLLDGVSKGLPALMAAQKLQEKAAKVGFDWPAVEPVWDKLYEEIQEFKAAIAEKNSEHEELEAGDVLFSLINLFRWYKIGGENALNRTNTKFRRRFAYVEACVNRQGNDWRKFTADELDSFWEAAKASEKGHSV